MTLTIDNVLKINKKYNITNILCCDWPSKVPAPAGVDDGVHGGVDPAEPGDDGADEFLVLDAAAAHAAQQVDHKERQPADDEDAHHDAQRLGRLFLLGEFGQAAAEREVSHVLGGDAIAAGFVARPVSLVRRAAAVVDAAAMDPQRQLQLARAHHHLWTQTRDFGKLHFFFKLMRN